MIVIGGEPDPHRPGPSPLERIPRGRPGTEPSVRLCQDSHRGGMWLEVCSLPASRSFSLHRISAGPRAACMGRRGDPDFLSEPRNRGQAFGAPCLGEGRGVDFESEKRRRRLPTSFGELKPQKRPRLTLTCRYLGDSIKEVTVQT